MFRGGVKFNSFLDKLNNLHKNLTFTYEFGGKTIPFLDTHITLDGHGFKSTVYRKNTSTDVMLNYGAVAPLAWKKGLIKCLLHRASVVCSNQALLQTEVAKIKEIFQKNGYPKEFVDTTVLEYNNKLARKERQEDNSAPSDTIEAEEKTSTTLMKVPYLGKSSLLFSRQIRKLIKRQHDQDIRVVYNTTKVADSFKLKDDSPKELLSKVVYRFKCLSDSDTQYIGYTNRPLRERVMEHLTKGNSAISDHIAACKECNDRGVKINNFEILRKCRSKADTPIFEAILIRKFNPSLNRQLVKPGWQHKLKVFN